MAVNRTQTARQKLLIISDRIIIKSGKGDIKHISSDVSVKMGKPEAFHRLRRGREIETDRKDRVGIYVLQQCTYTKFAEDETKIKKRQVLVL